MAFSKTPEQSTYRTERIPVVGFQQQRNGYSVEKDARFLNCYPEALKTKFSNEKKYFLKKRPGLAQVKFTGAGEGRGCIYVDSNGKVYLAIADTLYVYNVITLTLTGIKTLANSTGPVGFTQHRTASTLQVVAFDGIKGYIIDPVTDGVTDILSADFPTPHEPWPVSLDGYLFCVKLGTADIYNSNLDDPLTWTPGDFITAEMYPDNIQYIAKNNNYLIAVGSLSTEYFYDAGIASGSPLQRNDSAVLQFGTVAPHATVSVEKEVFIVGSTDSGGRTVWKIDGFTATEIASEPVKLALDYAANTIENATAYSIRSQGHKWYVLRLPTRTWVYDVEEDVWHEWTTGLTQLPFNGKWACDSPGGYPYILGAEDGCLYRLWDQAYIDELLLDGDTAINMVFTSAKIDFNTMNRKDMYRLSLFGDWPLDSTSAIITVDWSDDDYRTWNGARSINLASDMPFTNRLGKFRRRAFRLTFLANLPLRLEGMEADINMGAT